MNVQVIEEEPVEDDDSEKPQSEGSTDITQNWFTTRDDKNRLKLQHKGVLTQIVIRGDLIK